MPHICFVAQYAYPLLTGDYTEQILGGAELQQVTLARELASREYRVSMICLDFGQADGIEVDGITIHKTVRPNSGIPIFRFVHPRLTSLWSCLKRVDADIYYTRTASMLTGAVAAFALFYKKKTVFAAADNRDFSKHISRIRHRRDRWIHEWGIRNTDKLVVQNREQLALCRRNFNRDAAIIESCYSAPAARSQGRRDTVLWVSTIRALKRPDRLIALARLLPERRFVMVGGGDKYEGQLFEEIKEMAESEDNVDFIGFVPYSQIGLYFDKARVFVNTSETEGFPNTFLHSWARAVPTVSFVDCAARTGDRPVGYTVKSLDEMAGLVDRLIVDDAEYSRAGSRCSQYYRDNHTPQTVIRKYENLFDELLGQ